MKKSIVVGTVVAAMVGFGVPVVYADGAADYAAKCKMCHGPDGTGNPAMIKAMGEGVNIAKGGGDCVKTVADGKGKMGSFKDKLTTAQINDVCQYVKTTIFKK